MPALESAALENLFNVPRTVNHFTDRQVSDETLKAIVDLTKMGPTAFNSQPLRITWLRSAEARERLIPAMVEANQDKTRKAPVTAVLSFDKSWSARFPEFNARAADPMQGVFDGNDNLRHSVGRDNAHLQAGYFITAIRALGLAAGPMTGADFAKITEEFYPAGDRQAFLVVNLGYGIEPDYARNPRFTFEDTTETL